MPGPAIRLPDSIADINGLQTALDAKASSAAVAGKLAIASNLSDLTNVPVARTSLGLGTAAVLNTGTTDGTIPLLTAGGLLPTSTIPAVAVSEYLGNVASQAAMLALSGQRGDWTTRSDDGPSTWILTTDDPTQLANWKKLSTPTDSVLSVNGQAGVIVLTAANVGAYSTAQADTLLADKAPLASPPFTGVPTAPSADIGTETTQIATTYYVRKEIPNAVLSQSQVNGLGDALSDRALKVTTISSGGLITGGGDLSQNRTLTLAGETIFTDLLTRDGNGSGLDADVIRGTTPGAGGLAVLDDASTAAVLTTIGGVATTDNRLPTSSGTTTWSFSYLVNDFTQLRVTDFPSSGTADVHGVFWSHERSSFLVGRFNQGLNAGIEFAVFEKDLIPQYFLGAGWSYWGKGTQSTSPGDQAKGSAAIGYQVGVCASYALATNLNCIAVGAASFAGGNGCTSGHSTESSGLTAIATHTNSAKQVTLTGDKTAEFPGNAYVAVRQDDGSVNPTTTGLVRVTVSSHSGGVTTLTFNKKFPGDFNGTTATKVMNVTTGVLNSAFSFGKNCHAHGPQSVAMGEDVTLAFGATNGIGLGKTISNTGGANGVHLGLSIAAGTGSAPIQIGTSLTKTTHDFVTQIGTGHTSTNHRTTALGHTAAPIRYGEVAINNGMTNGGTGFMCLGSQDVTHSTSAWFPLFLDASAIGVTLTSATCMMVQILIVGINRTGGVKRIGFVITALVHRTGGTYTVVGSTVTPYNADDPSYEARVDGSSGYFAVEVRDTDGASGAMRWRAFLMQATAA